ncbi:MAG: hypothetical protein WA755_14910 [Candidatus Acidiferrales bacterium]
MKRVLGGMGLLTLLTFSLLAVPAGAQTTAAAKRVTVTPRYDASKEVTLKGTVQSVATKPPAGDAMGAHLFLATSSGVIDADLGIFALKGAHPLSLTPGQPVEVVGVMSTFNKNHLLLARSIQTGTQVFRIRNEHGLLLEPAQRNADPNSASKGALR